MFLGTSLKKITSTFHSKSINCTILNERHQLCVDHRGTTDATTGKLKKNKHMKAKNTYINKNIVIIECQIVYNARDINFLIPNNPNNLAKKILSWTLDIPTSKSQGLDCKTQPPP